MKNPPNPKPVSPRLFTPQGKIHPRGRGFKKNADGSFSFPKSMSAEDSATRNLNTPKRPRRRPEESSTPFRKDRNYRRGYGMRIAPRKSRMRG